VYQQGLALAKIEKSNQVNMSGLVLDMNTLELVHPPLNLPMVKEPEPVPTPVAPKVIVKTAPPAPKSTPAGPDTYDALFQQHFGDSWVSAKRIATCESGLVATKHNYNPATRDNSWGLFQVNLWGANARTRPSSAELIKAEVNIEFARNLWISQGRRFGTTGGWFNCARKLGII